MDKFNTHQVTMGIKKSIKQQNSKQKRHIAPKSKEFRSWILWKVIDNGKNNNLNIWILDDPKIWDTHLNWREVVMWGGWGLAVHSVKHTGHGFSFLSVKFYFVCFRNEKDAFGLCSILWGIHFFSVVFFNR